MGFNSSAKSNCKPLAVSLLLVTSIDILLRARHLREHATEMAQEFSWDDEWIPDEFSAGKI
jgi:hypothetical protein